MTRTRWTALFITVAAATAVVATVAPAVADPRPPGEGSSRVRTIEKTVAVDGRTIGEGRPGPMVARLGALYDELVAAECPPA